jgi:hypothetical protein
MNKLNLLSMLIFPACLIPLMHCWWSDRFKWWGQCGMVHGLQQPGLQKMIYTSLQCMLNCHASLKQTLPLCFVNVDVDVNIFTTSSPGKYTAIDVESEHLLCIHSMKFCFFHCQLTQSLGRQEKTIKQLGTHTLAATWHPNVYVFCTDHE